MSRIGIMQGRLVPPEPGRFQSFPRSQWQDELSLAPQVPLAYIEWIHDLYGADMNLFLQDPGQLRAMANQAGVGIHALCADYFMDLPFVRCSAAERAERERHLAQLLRRSRSAGIGRIVLPFVDASAIQSADDFEIAVQVLQNALPFAQEAGVELHLETSLPPEKFADLLARIPSPLVRVNYDSGNSSSLGYKPSEEFAAYGDRIGSVHIKDRILGGGTVPLGTGDADLPQVFRELEKIGYAGDITLQVARSEPGREVEWSRHNREFVAQYWMVE